MSDGWRSQPPPCAKGSGAGAGAGEGEGRWGTWVMGATAPPQAHPANMQAATWIATDYMPSYSAGGAAAASSNPNHMNYSAASAPVPGAGAGQNPYVNVAPVPDSSGKSSMDMILQILGVCGKKLEGSTRTAAGVAGNVWHHLKASPSFSEATMARLKHGTRVLAEGGRGHIFNQEFGVFPGEQLWKAYACYLSTTSGPVIGTLYLSNMRLAFCSDKPLCCNAASGQQEWVYYKVLVPLDQIRAVNPSASRTSPVEKYIELVTADGHEFWFMGFVSYDKALNNISQAISQFQS